MQQMYKAENIFRTKNISRLRVKTYFQCGQGHNLGTEPSSTSIFWVYDQRKTGETADAQAGLIHH